MSRRAAAGPAGQPGGEPPGGPAACPLRYGHRPDRHTRRPMPCSKPSSGHPVIDRQRRRLPHLARKREGAGRRPRRGGVGRRILPLVLRGSRPDHRRCLHLAVGRQLDPGGAPAHRRLRADHPLELPGGHGHEEAGSRAGGGLHRRAQTGHAHSAHRLGNRPTDGRRLLRQAAGNVLKCSSAPWNSAVTLRSWYSMTQTWRRPATAP
jgi:hypothetical protein